MADATRATGRRRSTETFAPTPSRASLSPVRREYLNDYLQHALVLAACRAPRPIEAQRSFLAGCVQPARKRARGRARLGLGLDDGPGRADGRVHLGAGRRDAVLQPTTGTAARPLGIRAGRRATRPDSRASTSRAQTRSAPRPARGRDPRLGEVDRDPENRRRRVRAARSRTRSATSTSTARATAEPGGRSEPGRSAAHDRAADRDA